MYATGMRTPTGILYGFSEKGESGKTKFMFLQYYEEQSDLKEDVDLIEKLTKKWKKELRKNEDGWKKFKGTNKECEKTDSSARSLFERVKKTNLFQHAFK